jgi:UDP-glucose 4-epimerase
MKILVTGAAGFIGSHLCDELLKNHEVTGMDNLRNGKMENLSEALSSKNFNFIEGDILDPATCEKVTKNMDVVFHLACLGVRHSLHSPVENHNVNAGGTLCMLEAATKNKVLQFFYISTSEIYGDVKNFPIRETDTPYPKTVYGSSKLAGEHYTYSYYKKEGLNTMTLRIFNNYGPRAHHEGDAGEIIPRSIVKALYGQPPVLFGNGLITRDFYYVKDTAAVLASLVGRTGLEGEIIHIGNGKEVTLQNLIQKILTLMGKDPSQIEYLESRPADVTRLWVDTIKFNKLIGYKQKYSFEEGLKETIFYYETLKAKKNLLNEIKLKNWE